MKMFIVIWAVLCTAISAFAGLTLVEDANSLHAQNIQASNLGATYNAPLLTFTLKADGPSVVVQGVSLGSFGSITPTTIYFYDGANLLYSSVVHPYNYNTYPVQLNIPANTAKVLRVSGDFAAVSTAGTAQLKLYDVVVDGYTNPVQPNTFGSVINGPINRIKPVVANFSPYGLPTATSNFGQNGATADVSVAFPMVVSALGGSVKIGSVTVVAASVNGVDLVVCKNVAVASVPNGDIADMSSSVVTATANFSVGEFPRSGPYWFCVQQINWSASDGSNETEQYWGLENLVTPNSTSVTKITSSQVVQFRLPLISYNLYQGVDNIKLGGEWGSAGQIVSEGGILRISRENLNPTTYIIFPVNSSNGGQIMKIDVGMTPTSMTPIITAPANPLEEAGVWEGHNNPDVDWLVSDVVSGQNSETFTIHIGDFTGYGTISRTGDYSCIIRMYWGNGATYSSPGYELDMLDKSPSTVPSPNPKGLVQQPVRMKFGLKDVPLMTGSTFSTRADLLLGGVTVEQSADLINWSVVGNYDLQVNGTNSDGTSDCLINISTSGPRLYYRLKLNQ